MSERRRRLIEVAFPLEEVSEYSRRDPYLGPPHPQTLHRWWARRPLPACRAFIYASLVDDPETDKEREELLKEVADLASWDAVRKPDQVVRTKEEGGSGLTGTELLERARRRILECNGGKPPRLLDPFAGGGAIPLEALRLGCEVEASDLNPVAVLILKGTVEYPQKYGQPDSRPVPDYIYRVEQGAEASGTQVMFGDGRAGESPPAGTGNVGATYRRGSTGGGNVGAAYLKNPLATDVRYWGNWMLERAREELAEFYPPDPDGSVPVAYLWSRTVPCPNCHAEMPLIRQYWLARKDNKKVALKPVLDREHDRVDFEVVEAADVTGDPAEATTSGGDTLCLLCRQVVKADYVRSHAQASGLGSRMTAVVLEAGSSGGKRYRGATASDLSTFSAAQAKARRLEGQVIGDLPLVPDEPIDPKTLGLRIDAFGIGTWGELFNARQLLMLSTLARSVAEASAEMQRSGLDASYACAISTYLGLALDRLAGENSTLTRWNPSGPKAQGAMALQALSMVWDYAELNPWGGSVGDAKSAIEIVASAIELASRTNSGDSATVTRRDARDAVAGSVDAVITDPPYYNSVDYAGLSDYFYVWLKRSIGQLCHRDLLGLPLTPKKEQAIMASESHDSAARERYVVLMREAFASCSEAVERDGIIGVVFAHTDPDAWATLIDGLIQTGLVPDASWPLDTEIRTKYSAVGQARLKTSVWMACRPRQEYPREAFLGDVLEEMRPVIKERLLYFWSKGIRGADFFISAIGPALSVFGRHSRVLRPDGTEVTVREFLDLVRRESTQVALEQVLQGADLGVVDTVTRQYVTWAWSYSRAPLEAGETIALCLATGVEYGEVVRPDSIAVEAKEKSKKVVKLRTIRERGRDDENLGGDSPARPAPLIDQLQRAAWLWGQNRADELSSYRGALGELRWSALRVLGQAVAECLPNGDDDRRLIHGLLGSNVMGQPAPNARSESEAATATLPGFEEAGERDG